jgi:DNA replication protein DnaC
MMPNDLVLDPDTVDIDAMLKRLNLANARRVWKDLVHRADAENWSARTFLSTLVAEEIAHRQQTRITRSVRAAGFPFLKTIDEFDFSLQKSLKRRLISS